MTDVLKVLGQMNPAAGILTDFYTVPALTSATISSIVICNLDVVSIGFNISIAVGGIADNTKQYIYYTMPLDTNDTFIATIGISLASGDVVRILATSNNVAFNMFGVEA